MQFTRSGSLIVICVLASFVAWGQSIQPAQIQPVQIQPVQIQPVQIQPVQDAPIQNAPTQNAPVQNTAVQPDSPRNGGDFSTLSHPKPEEIVPKDTIIVKGAWSGASDSTTPLPEAAALTNNVFTD